MSEDKHSTTSIKDSDDEFIESLAEKVLQRLVESGTLTPWLDADGAVRYRITSEINRLSTANRRRRD